MHDAHHEPAVREIRRLRRPDTRIQVSVVSIAELASDRRPGRRKRIANLESFVDMLGDDAVVELNRAIAMRAGELRATRKSLRLADALIKATSELLGSSELLTTDRALARLDGARYIGT